MIITSTTFVKGVVAMSDPIFNDGLPQIAFIGRSNVGKSSIINSLLGRTKLVKVGKKPGKTTEINFFKVNQVFYLVDLPGYGYAKVTLEKKRKIESMIHSYITHKNFTPYRLVLVIDIKAGVTTLDKEIITMLKKYHKAYTVLINKSDALNQKEAALRVKKITLDALTTDVFVYSAKTKKNASVLLEALLEK